MNRAIPTLYLFNNIFFPETIIPLSVNDSTSKNMLKNCFEKNSEIVLYLPHQRSKAIGTLGRILMIDYNQDGSMSIMVQGLKRIRLLSMQQQIPYPMYYTEDFFDYKEQGQILAHSPIERLYHVLDKWLTRNVHSKKERETLMREINSPVKLINHLCMLVLKDVEIKQIFLESPSLIDRIRMMNALLSEDQVENENREIAQAIKNFERLDSEDFKTAS